MSIVLVYLVYCFITLANVKNIVLRVFLVERSAIYVTGTEFVLQNGSLNLISFDIFIDYVLIKLFTTFHMRYQSVQSDSFWILAKFQESQW